MEDYSDVPIPPSSYHMDSESLDKSGMNAVEMDSDSLWQQQLVDTEQQILREKESGKRLSEDDSEDEPLSKKKATEFEKLLKNVNDNPADFQSWTLLLQYVDQSSDLESGRKAYDEFFLRYPYCYGYWKKYAELEKRKGTDDSVMKVFNQGLTAVPLSVDLWIHFLDYTVSKYPDDQSFVREQFERAVDSCGLEFRSDKLWDQYISWETSCKCWKEVTALYQKLIATPISKYLQHWQRFQEHIKKHNPSEVLGVDEYLRLRKSVLSHLDLLDTDKPDEAPPGVEAAPGNEQINIDEEVKVIQTRFIESWEKIHEETVMESKARWAYEDAIKRPYFHVKPLEKSQLNAWRCYLDFEMSQMNHLRIKILFERCLIACAFYEEFWMKYINYLEERGASKEELRSVFIRVCTIHLRDKLRPQLSWAAFEEESDNSDKAMEILLEVQQRIPFSLEAYMMAAGIERRRGNLKAADLFYQSSLDVFKSKGDRHAYSCLVIKYCRFLTLFRNDADKAVEVIQEGLDIDETNCNLILALVDTCLACRPPKFSTAAHALKTGTMNYFAPSTRMMFAHRYLNFITECATDERSMRDALQTMRDVQHEIRQIEMATEDGISSPAKLPEADNPLKKMSNASIVSSAEKTMANSATSTATTSSATSVNGTSTSPSQTSASYSNYSSQGYNYSQAYSQAYGGPQYQSWGYPAQQGNYGYNQQNWGSYPNYYGQR